MQLVSMSRSRQPARTTLHLHQAAASTLTNNIILLLVIVIVLGHQQVRGRREAFAAVRAAVVLRRSIDNHQTGFRRGVVAPRFFTSLDSSSNCDDENDGYRIDRGSAQREKAACLFFATSTTINNSKEPQEQQATASAAAASRTVFVGRVVRIATKAYHADHSQPSSRQYTTRKVSQKTSIQVTAEGCTGDYNHYRTTALKNTPNRAVSILTTDALQVLRSYDYPVRDGDLGENVLVDGVAFDFFRVGEQYQFVNTKSSSSSSDDDDADKSATIDVLVIEITEPMVPCGNLCKLPYINDDAKAPRERVQACQDFLSILNQPVGLRGWYAKVVQPGRIDPNARVVRV